MASTAKTMTVTVSVSTDLRFVERYFIDVRDTTGGRNIQKLVRHADADFARRFIRRIERDAVKYGITVTVTDESGELYSPRIASPGTRRALYTDFVNSLSFPDVEEYGFERAVAEDVTTGQPRHDADFLTV